MTCGLPPELAGLGYTALAIDYVIPTGMLFSCTVVLAIALKTRESSASALRSGPPPAPTSGALRCTLTVLLVSVSRCLVYVPYATLQVAAHLVPEITELYKILYMSNYFAMLSPLCPTADFAVYCALIPSFRAAAYETLLCLHLRNRRPNQNHGHGTSRVAKALASAYRGLTAT